MFEYKALELKNFHGGITDNFIDCQLYQYEKADNFLVSVNRELYTRPGSVIYDSVTYQLPSGSQRVNAIVDHFDTLFFISSKQLYYINSGAWSTLQGPTSNSVLTAGDTTSSVSWSDWNKHTFITNDAFAPVMKVYRDGSNVVQARTAGIPKLASSPTITKGGTTTDQNYIYSFMYFYEYNVGTVLFQDFGAVTQVQITDATAPDSSTVAITAIPVLSNSTVYNFDTTNIKVKIYRTQVNGTTSTFLGEVTNGTTTYNDSASDSSIASNSSLYIDSGQVDRDPVPLCKCLHITDTLGLYGHIKTADGQILSNRVRQSVPEDPDSSPESFYVDLDDSIVAISSVGQTPVVFCEKSVYRLDGNFDAVGDGVIQAQEIESTVGCISQSSVVQIQRGIIFAGESGFYFTDAWEVRKLSSSFNDTYNLLIQTAEQKRRIYSIFDRTEKRVWIAVQEAGESDVNKYYVLDTRYGLGIAGDDLENVKTCFTTVSNGEYFAPTASIFHDGELIRGDSRGYIFKHGKSYYSDPRINTSLAPSLWASKSIIWDFISLATSFNSITVRKFVPKCSVSAENITDVSIQINSINDVGRLMRSIKPIRFRQNWIWGDPTKVWGTEKYVWDFSGMIEELRRFSSESLRCNYKQLQLTNAYTTILTSDDLTTVTINSAAKTATLDDISTYDWPTDIVGHYIYFKQDDYLLGFEITARTNDVVTFVDASNKVSAISQKWMIKGYPKNEIINIRGISLWFAYLGQPNDYSASSSRSEP